MAQMTGRNPKIATLMSNNPKAANLITKARERGPRNMAEVDAADAKGWTVDEYRQQESYKQGDPFYRPTTVVEQRQADRYREKKRQKALGPQIGPGEGA